MTTGMRDKKCEHSLSLSPSGLQSSNPKALDRSALFTAYNALRALAVQNELDMGRVNRALGVAQRKASGKYETTADTCTCPDATYRPWKVCKHRLAIVMQEAAS